MLIRFITFLVTITTALSLAGLYIGRSWMRASSWARAHSQVTWGILILFMVMQVLGPLIYRLFPSRTPLATVLSYIMYTALGAFSCFLIYLLSINAVLFLAKFFGIKFNESTWSQYSFYAVFAFTLISLAFGVYETWRGPKVERVQIPIKNLAPELEGFKIVQISDLHVGPTIGAKYVKKVVGISNQLNPDLVVLTGDLIDGQVPDLHQDTQLLKGLQSLHGTYFITGNHEYYWGAKEWVEEFRSYGIIPLINENKSIQHKGKELFLAGITDLSAGKLEVEHAPSLEKALQGSSGKNPIVLLSHQPGIYEEAKQRGVHLQLSGHTHGGQFFPWTLVVNLVHRYSRGLNDHQGLWVYVNRGVGYWGPPLRFGSPSEISLLSLTRAP